MDQPSEQINLFQGQIKSERIAILGASRGLGKALAVNLAKNEDFTLLLTSRKMTNPVFKQAFAPYDHRVTFFSADFTKPEEVRAIFEQLKQFNAGRIIYCAGGGPFGLYEDRPWHSHAWAFQLNLLFPAQLLHHLLGASQADFRSLKQVIFIGSAIAETKPDPGAASYSAAKHGLKGLMASVIEENRELELDIRLYSPGYMDTSMLPPNSRPRQDGSLIADPEKIADDLSTWIQSPPSRTHWHRIIGIDSV